MQAQTARLKSHLDRNRKITSYSAMELLGIASLHRRLADLREQGYEVSASWQEITNRFGDKVRIKVYRKKISHTA